MKTTFLAALAGSSIAAIVAAVPAVAQNAQQNQTQPPAQPPAEDDEDEEEIVITGSQIRGIAPAGSTVIGLNAEEVEATGASSGLDVLRDVPQIVNTFQGLPSPGNVSTGV